MWCARLSLSRPDSAVVVRAGRNLAAFGSPFFLSRSCFLRSRCVQQPSSLECVAFLLRSSRQQLGVFGFTCVIRSRKACSLTPFVQCLVASIAYLRSGPDAAYGFKRKCNSARKICGVQHDNLHLSTYG